MVSQMYMRVYRKWQFMSLKYRYITESNMYIRSITQKSRTSKKLNAFLA